MKKTFRNITLGILLVLFTPSTIQAQLTNSSYKTEKNCAGIFNQLGYCMSKDAQLILTQISMINAGDYKITKDGEIIYKMDPFNEISTLFYQPSKTTLELASKYSFPDEPENSDGLITNNGAKKLLEEILGTIIQ